MDDLSAGDSSQTQITRSTNVGIVSSRQTQNDNASTNYAKSVTSTAKSIANGNFQYHQPVPCPSFCTHCVISEIQFGNNVDRIFDTRSILLSTTGSPSHNGLTALNETHKNEYDSQYEGYSVWHSIEIIPPSLKRWGFDDADK